jgi:hypothetical protein
MPPQETPSLVTWPAFSTEIKAHDEYFDSVDVNLPVVGEYLIQKGAAPNVVANWSLRLLYENADGTDPDPSVMGHTIFDSKCINIYASGVLANAGIKYLDDRVGPAAIDNPPPSFDTYVEQSLNAAARHELSHCADMTDATLLNEMIDYENETALQLRDARRLVDKYNNSRWLGTKIWMADVALATHSPLSVLVIGAAILGVDVVFGKSYGQHLKQLLELVHTERYADDPHEQRARAAEAEQTTFFTVRCDKKRQAILDKHIASL